MRTETGTSALGKVVRGGVEHLPQRYPLWLRISFWICIVIAVAAVVRRGFALVAPPNGSGPQDLVELDAFFVSHAALTWAHIGSALVFVSLLPFLFWRRTRNSRRLENAFLLVGLIVGLTAYAMSVHAVGGWVERSAVLLFNTLFLFCLARVFVLRRSDDAVRKRQWMFRAVAVVLGIAVTRPVMGVFFATSRMTHWTAHQFFGVAFWIGFSLSTLTAEVWLRNSKFAGDSV
jgi:hypothetical protein